jgi:uncharacterized membrane protein
MSDGMDPTPTLGQRTAILCLAAVVGVIVDVLLWQLRPTLTNLHHGLFFSWPPLSFFVLCIVVGSFIAIPLCLAVGLPLWHLAQRWRRHRLHDALWAGLLAGAIIGTLMALPKIAGDSSWYAFDRNDLFEFAEYGIAGLCAGWVAHRLGYPGS